MLNQAKRYASQHIWCLSQARINWEGYARNCMWIWDSTDNITYREWVPSDYALWRQSEYFILPMMTQLTGWNEQHWKHSINENELLVTILATFIVESVVVSGSQKMGTGTGSWQRERCMEYIWELDAVGVVVNAAANIAPFAGELQSYMAFNWPSFTLLCLPQSLPPSLHRKITLCKKIRN